MIVSPFEVYLIMQLDKINAVFSWVSILLISITAVLFIKGAMDKAFAISEGDPDYKKGEVQQRMSLKTGIAAAVLSIFVAFIPNTKTVAAMYLVPSVINNEQVQKLPEDLLKLFRGLIKDWTPKIEEKEGRI